MTITWHIICHELFRHIKKSGTALSILFFFIISASLFPFGIGIETDLLQNVASGIVWVCVLLASLIGIPHIFAEDYEDGTLVQLLLTGALTEYIILAKLIAHWLVTALPLIIITPVVAAFFQLSGNMLQHMLVTLLIGTPALTCIGGLGAALTLGLRRGQALLGVIILPLYIPFLIFGAGSQPEHSAAGLLAGITLLMLPICIFACSTAVKSAVAEN